MPKTETAAVAELDLREVVVEAIKRKCESGEIPPGEYPLRGTATVRLDCTLQKGEPGESKQPYKPDWPALIAVILGRCWVYNEPLVFVHEIAHLIERAAKYEADGHVNQEYRDVVAAALKHAGEAITADLPKIPRAGATKVTGSVELARWTPK